jgi:hypothetical protein
MKIFKGLITACVLWFCCSGVALAQPIEGGITISWDDNLESDMAGYRIYVDEQPTLQDAINGTRQYKRVIDVNSLASVFTITGLEVGKDYWITVTAYDTSDNESGYASDGQGGHMELKATAKDIIIPSSVKNLKEVTTNVN